MRKFTGLRGELVATADNGDHTGLRLDCDDWDGHGPALARRPALPYPVRRTEAHADEGAASHQTLTSRIDEAEMQFADVWSAINALHVKSDIRETAEHEARANDAGV
jgi:hypothetical protein